MRRLFVRLPNWVGDVVMAAPALAALRERLPEARIAWGCRPYVRRLLEAMPAGDRDEVLVEDQGRFAFIRALKTSRFDAAVVMSSSFGSAFEAWAAGIPRRIGHAGHGRGLLLTDALPTYPEPVYMGRLYGELAAALTGAAPSGPMKLVPSTEDEAKAAALWSRLGLDGKKAVGLVPGASFGSAKCWPHFGALAKGLLSEGLAVLLLFGPGEEALAGRIRAEAGEGLLPVGPDAVDLGVLPAVMQRLAVAVTNDTGPRHIAEALGVPVVVLLGPMDRRYTESGNPLVKVLQEPVDCHPCNLRECPIDHRCLVRLRPERVLEEVTRIR